MEDKEWETMVTETMVETIVMARETMVETMAGRHQKKKMEDKEWEIMARETIVETMAGQNIQVACRESTGEHRFLQSLKHSLSSCWR